MKQLLKRTELINEELEKYVNLWEIPNSIKQAIFHILKSGGKRIRPLLTILSCEAVGGNSTAVLRAAIAIELIHNASLLWDDVIDEDNLRRGRITVHKKWNKNIAILSGAMLTSKAIELISPTPQILDLYLKAISKMIEGQVMDISSSLDTNKELFESKSEKEVFEILRTRFRQKLIEELEWDASEEPQLIAEFTEFEEERDYFEMISYKTSSLLKLATRIGALLGGGSQTEIQALTRYGFYLGLAFQIRDDLIGLISTETAMGKPVGSDIKQKKLNLYTIFALRNLGNRALRTFLQLLQDTNVSASISQIRTILEECGALDYTRKKLKSIAQKAHRALSILSDSEPKSILNELIDFIIEREF
ncbi:MAG: polyprenyl synthetase family protein [Candidatus Helarchaeota archaeon]